jgi:hypothetical protein
MRKSRQVCVAIAGVVVAMALSACVADRCEETSHETYHKAMHRYAELNTNKAIYVNTEDHCFNWTWNHASLRAAIDAARMQCERNARERGVDPARCTEVAANDRQIWYAEAEQ